MILEVLRLGCVSRCTQAAKLILVALMLGWVSRCTQAAKVILVVLMLGRVSCRGRLCFYLSISCGRSGLSTKYLHINIKKLCVHVGVREVGSG